MTRAADNGTPKARGGREPHKRKQNRAGANDSEKLLDRTGLALLQLVQGNARLTYAELGKRVGLTAPAVAERLRRMEEAGLIIGWHAQAGARALGLAVMVFIRVGDCEPGERLAGFAARQPEVVECHAVTGSDSFILKALFASVQHVDEFISRLQPYAKSITTSIVLRSARDTRVIGEALVARGGAARAQPL